MDAPTAPHCCHLAPLVALWGEGALHGVPRFLFNRGPWSQSGPAAINDLGESWRGQSSSR